LIEASSTPVFSGVVLSRSEKLCDLQTGQRPAVNDHLIRTMDKIPIPETDVASIDHVAAELTGIRIMMVNVFAIGTAANWTLVDAGLPYSTDRILSWAEQRFGERSRPKSIILTHGHFDHVGALKELADHWDVPVYAHALEMPYITGQKEYPPPNPSVGGGLMSLLSPIYPRGPIDVSRRVRPLPRENSLPDLPGWRWIYTPGHTDGHVSFFRDQDRTLIAGDAVSTTKAESLIAIATQRPELHGPPAYYTSNWDLARESVENLAALRPLTVAAGHGKPMSGAEVADTLQQLAANFDEVARPKKVRDAA
jgi:glyoxylase-like metal-dependent hydrolase (beta-lactamase superfamily II)